MPIIWTTSGTPFYLIKLPTVLPTPCWQNFTHMWSLHNRIDTPIKTEKVDGPTNRLTFLGTALDILITITMEASVSPQQKSSLLTIIHSFMISTSKKCTKQGLLSIIGKLSFACKVQWFRQVASSYLFDKSTRHVHDISL